MIPEQLKNPNFRFCLIKARDKVPLEKDWTVTNNYKFDDLKLLTHIESTGNYGVICGYGNLLVVDFDNEEVQKEIDPLLPQTFTVKTGRGLLHKYYITDSSETIKVLNEFKNTLADIQGKGKQVIGPNSIHPNGNIYEVVDDVPIATIPMSEVRALFARYQSVEQANKVHHQQPLILDELAEEIKSKINVIDVLKKYRVDVSKNPTKCPFHESTGGKCLSFKANLWHCFHCLAGGDIFNFEMMINKIDFKEAKKRFAYDLGIDEGINGELDLTDPYTSVKKFFSKTPFYFDNAEMFWFYNKTKFKWEVIDETELIVQICHRFKSEGKIIKSGIEGQYLRSFKQIGRKNELILPQKNWIQFKDKVVDIKTKQMFEADSKYFFTNPIPWEIGKSPDTPVMDKLLGEWLSVEDKQTFYELLAYCCYPDYPIHLIFCFVGSGRNGKSKALQLIQKFLGFENTSSTELDSILNSRFESIKLHKKLACIMGETNFGILQNTSFLKKITGQDLVGFEMKGKKPFDDVNYAKILISSNSLPTSEDTSDGFYRRWFILDFPNQFEEGKDILEQIPESEFNNLANKVVGILPNLIANGKFTNQRSIEERKQSYIMASNPLPYFISEYCERGTEYHVKYADLYSSYTTYLNISKKRAVSHKEFRSALEREGLFVDRATINMENAQFVKFLQLKSDFDQKITRITRITVFSSSLNLKKNTTTIESSNSSNSSNFLWPESEKNELKSDFTQQRLNHD